MENQITFNKFDYTLLACGAALLTALTYVAAVIFI
ncbi:DUF3948 domain-containing protein [Bacillus cytotoxicus]|uniref:DUF3948 domain-containing protein n=1 Tax=Bacillus cytotoxicus TaxID=580165 RepID=A0ACC6A8S0_9BACI|nr:DUF3948 domain-containing protein [Bacillus cytotoxicus]